MAQFSVNTHRFDPYKNFKFRIKWDGKYVAGVSKISALKRTTEPITCARAATRAGQRGSPSACEVRAGHARARRHPRPRVREVGEPRQPPGGDGGMSLKNFRKDIVIELLNEAGQVAKACRCTGAG